MKAWRKYRGREIFPEHWRWAVSLRRFVDRGTFFLLAKGKRVRFERKRDMQMKRAMWLVQTARDMRDGDHNAGEKPR